MSDNLGNRFEKRWVVRPLLHLQAGRIRSVKCKPVGRDERGVDLWIVRADGRGEAQQCKGELGTRAEWSVADLARLRILDHLREQLGRDGSHEYAPVSATPAELFHNLTRSARAAEDAASYVRTLALLPRASTGIPQGLRALHGPLGNPGGRAPGRDHASSTAHDVSGIGPLPIRLYEQAGRRPGTRRRCLDAWDVMLERRVGTAGQITGLLDA